MKTTRRFWTIATLGIFFATLGILLDQSLLFLGTIGIGSWLLAHQYWFVRELRATDKDLRVEQRLPRERLSEDSSMDITLSVDGLEYSPLDLEIEANPPPSATGSTRSSRTVEIAAGDGAGTSTFRLTWPVAGLFRFGQPTIRARDPFGLFYEEYAAGTTPEITVEPPESLDIHVGEGGQQSGPSSRMRYGDQPSGEAGIGIEPLEVREYHPSDDARHIDWKASARLQDIFVREFEAERERPTALFVDHGTSMADPTEGESKIDYARSVALSIVEFTEDSRSPIALYTVADDGLSTQIGSQSTPSHYQFVRSHLFDLRPPNVMENARTRVSAVDPSIAGQAASRLEGDRTTFGTKLRPFFSYSTPYFRRIDENPLFNSVQTYLRRRRSPVLTAIVTDDEDRVQTRETVKAAQKNSEHVVVFLLPTVLFENVAEVEIEAAYDRYVEFEKFRRGLSALSNVTAFEVVPGERLEAILSQRRRGDSY